ncbi:MFS transporter [Streptacidiphilus sp. ASG 303]|uniref:MFS transporter n=1 Tax=Streptacidiphilus sp. ASG 303 TaxID=2896847 RepID=UPI001E652A08|nr:MFS transporter [Streptacidiphilus sp. ASG 303]MCD0483775.1 MFS transporter [Streptacidiphilus sp. ASG 303]
MQRRNGTRRSGGPVGGGTPSAARTLFLVLAAENLVINYTATAMNVALSALVGDLHTTLTGVQSAISLYALVVAAFIISGSKLGTRHGYRRTFALGGGTFVLGALITASAPSLPFVLLGWSVLQGLGVALMLPALMAMLTRTFTGAVRTRVLSLLAMTSGVGAASGPVLGGLVTTYLSWRVSFLLGAVTTLAVVWLMRCTAGAGPFPGRPGRRLDAVGVLLSTAGLVLLVVAALFAGRYGLLRARQDFEVLGRTLLERGGLSPVPLLAGLGLLVLAAFAAWELRLVRTGGDPLVRVTVLRNRAVRTGISTQLMLILVPNGVLFLIPVFLQTTFGFSALHCGVVLLPITLGLMAAAPPTARRIGRGRTTHRAASMGAFVCMGAGCVAVAVLFSPHAQGVAAVGLALAPGVLLIGLGRGMATTLTDLVQSAPASDEVSDVTGLSYTAGYLGSSFGVALAGALMTTALLYAFEAGTDGSAVLSTAQKGMVTRTLEHQVQITAVNDDALRARAASRGVTGAAGGELVRINARARERALAVSATGMAALAVVGWLMARRLPVPAGTATDAGPGRGAPAQDR